MRIFFRNALVIQKLFLPLQPQTRKQNACRSGDAQQRMARSSIG